MGGPHPNPGSDWHLGVSIDSDSWMVFLKEDPMNMYDLEVPP